MKRIFYGLSGEGLGHASRTLSVIDQLPDCEVHVFTYGKAYEYFKNIGYPHCHKIEGMMFSYKLGGLRVDYLNTLKNAWKYYKKNLKKNIDLIYDRFDMLQPSLFMSDFEPSIPRAAKICKVPLISVDNQHRFAYMNMVKLPLFLRLYGWGCGFAVRILVPKPKHTIISTFHYDLIETKNPNVVLTNGLLRKDVEETQPTKGDYLLVYMRYSVSRVFMDAIKNLNMSVKVYGWPHLGIRMPDPRWNHITFCPLGPSFVKDLAGCKALLCTAGNQLITEARYYQKPCLVVPEPGQYEQYINAFYVEELGIGKKCEALKLNENTVKNFLNNFIPKKYRVDNGVYKVVEIVRRYLS